MKRHISPEHMITFLLETPFFEKLEPRELQEIIHIVKEVEYKAGDILFEEGDSGDAWYVVYRGAVDILKYGEKIAEIGEKGCFGEMSILDKLPRSATVRAAIDSIFLRVSSEDFDKLTNEKHPVAYKLIHEMAILSSQRQRDTTAKLSLLLQSSDVNDVHAGIRCIVGESTVRE
jgi:CRP/FNR family cyclic AMP-dependent transcriptional regulator